MCSTLAIICVIGLIIGLPTIIVGCNDFSCPLQEKLVSKADNSYYVKEECTSSTCVSYGKDGQCSIYTYDTYDCSYWMTHMIYSKGSCDIRSGPYDKGTAITMFVNKLDNTCNSNIEMVSRLPIVGIVFLSISGIALMLMFMIPFCCNEK